MSRGDRQDSAGACDSKDLSSPATRACLSPDDGWTTLRFPALRHPGIPVGRSGARPEPCGGQDHLRGRFPRQALPSICVPTPGIYELFRRCRYV